MTQVVALDEAEEHGARYPYLSKLSAPLRPAEREIIGREAEVEQLLAAMERPELCNALLLAEAGTGKTALVQATMVADERRREADPALPRRRYLEVDPARMIDEAGDKERMAALLKAFFDEAEEYVRDTGEQLVLFIDEFHQIIQLSDAATEAVKPVLAASGTRGIRIIAATTYAEFHQHISPNQPLRERLQRINVRPPDRDTVVRILRGFAERYGVSGQFYDDHLLRRIHELTERYNPAAAQPRKSILVLDSMIGKHRLRGRPMDTGLLAEVLHESLGVDVQMQVDGGGIRRRLNEAVFAQEMATEAVSRRLQLSVADLNDKSRPEASFLFAGATGVGKTALTKVLATLLFPSDPRALIRFDMTEFADESSLGLFRSELTREMWNRPNSILLLDEVEKAASSVTRVLLQVLDDGRLSDDSGREVSFLNSYIVMTTNAGSEVFREIGHYAKDDGGAGGGRSLGQQVEHYTKLIRESITSTTSGNRFPPELLGRIDVIVPFSPLLESTLERIIRRRLDQLVSEVWRKHSLRLGVADERIIKYLIHDKGDTDTDAGGARGIMSIFTAEIATEVAAFINTHPGCTRAAVLVEGELASETNNAYTDAHIVVVPK